MTTNPSPAPPSLAEVYEQYFTMVRADTPALREVAFRLRYQVYCVENAFEDPSHFPDRMEYDAYDRRAVHALLVHRPTGNVAGTVRLILPDGGRPTDLPFHSVCRNRAPFPPGSTAEISRFAISKDFRRRQSDGLYPDEHSVARDDTSGPTDQRLIPTMAIGLMREIARMSTEKGVTHWCAVMMPALLRLLGRLGIHFHPAGPPVQYHGRRQPCYRDGVELLAQVRTEQPAIWDFLTENGRLFSAREAARAAASR